MNKNKTTECAFPFKENGPNDSPGLTKREYFAAMAMQADFSIYESGADFTDAQLEKIAQRAYRVADAMLKQGNDSSTD